MVESLLTVGAVWLLHAAIGGLPAMVAILRGRGNRWGYCLALLIVPFWALLTAQMIWPVGGMSSYLLRLTILTVIVFIAQLIKVLPFMSEASAGYHLSLLIIAVLAVVPIQLAVPSYPD